MHKVRLNNGTMIPAIGFGVFLIPDDGTCEKAVGCALETGYRFIDTAAAYMNEAGVGRAVRASGLPREEIYITSKLWLQDYGYDAAKKRNRKLSQKSRSRLHRSLSSASAVL